MDAKQTACYHCKTLLSLPKEHSNYWRCGHCRKVNGRPNYARGFVSGFLYCGLCRFYSGEYAWPLWLLGGSLWSCR